MDETKPVYRCLSCDRSEKEAPLIALRHRGGQAWICPQCLPVLIHHSEQLADKLAAIDQHLPAFRAE